MKPDTAAILDAFDRQVEFSRLLGSEFMAHVVAACAADIRGGGPTAKLVAQAEGDPVDSALCMRVAGGLHRHALDDPDGGLASLYPSGADHGSATDGALRAAIAEAIESAPDLHRDYLTRAPQTNEVSRSAILMAGYLTIVENDGLPLDVREIGASAGLNQSFDRFHYRFGDSSWGEASAPVRLEPSWRGDPPPVDAGLHVRSRAACDIAPIDVRDPEAVRRLEAYVWPDQPARMQRLRAAVALAANLDVRVERASADAWLQQQLADRTPGATMVVAHSVMWQYMPAEVQCRAEAAIVDAGRQATQDAPLAWLSMELWEDRQKPPVLRLRSWPDDRVRDLAVAHPHGAAARWFG